MVKPRSVENIMDFGHRSLMGTSNDVATLTILTRRMYQYRYAVKGQTLTTSVPNTHQMSYRNKPDNRTHPVLKESNLSRDRALCENDRAKRSVRNAERRVALPPKVYRIEGIEPAGIRNSEGVRSESDTSSRGPQMSHEVERKAKDCAPLVPLVIVTRLLSNFLQFSSPRIHRDREIRD